MKLLYGVQGTGNGHIARAHAMASAFCPYPEIEVTWLISGRPAEDVFNAPANEFLWRRGLTFQTERGRVRYLRTFLSNSYLQLAADAISLDLDDYDQIVIDFEPVTAWAARLRRREVLGIGHQYAFRYAVPRQGESLLTRCGMRAFAPVGPAIGLHWHHFGQPILPPIIDLDGHARQPPVPGKVVVYLPFESQREVIELLRPLTDNDFFVYGPGLEDLDRQHIHTRALSRTGFKRDLVSATSVICNAGFELVSECLSLGVRVMVKPVGKQLEQLSNALALEQLGYAAVTETLNRRAISDWLERRDSVQIDFGHVHEQIAAWLVGGRTQSIADLSEETWSAVRVRRSTTESASEAA